MASAQAKIDVIISGLREAAALEDRLKSIQSTVDALRRTPIDLNIGGRGATRDRSGKLSKNVNDLVRNFNNFGKSLSSVSKQASLFGDLLSQTSLRSTGEFKRQDVAVRNLATAYTTATAQAARFDQQQINLVRTSKGLQTSIEREIELINRRNRISMGRKAQERGQKAVSGAITGGAFPLLFGQGPVGALGGGLGGAIGGLKGGGLDLGLSLVGSQLGSVVDDLIKKLDDLSVALKSPTETIKALEDAGYKVDFAIKDQIETLLESGQAYEAQKLALQEVNAALGPDAVSQLTQYASETDALKAKYQDVVAQISSELLPVLVSLAAGLKTVADAFSAIAQSPLFQVLGQANQIASLANPIGMTIQGLQYTGQQLSQGATPTLSSEEQQKAFEIIQKQVDEEDKRNALINARLNITRAELALQTSGLDLTTQEGYALAVKVVQAQNYERLQRIINANYDVETAQLQFTIAALQTKLALASLNAKRDAAVAAANVRVQRSAVSYGRSQSQLENESIRNQQTLNNLRIKQINQVIEDQRLTKTALQALTDEIQHLKNRYVYEAKNIEISKDSLEVKEQQNLVLKNQFRIRNLQISQQIAQLKVEKLITKQKLDQVKLEAKLEAQQKLRSLAIPTPGAGTLLGLSEFRSNLYQQDLETFTQLSAAVQDYNKQIALATEQEAGPQYIQNLKNQRDLAKANLEVFQAYASAIREATVAQEVYNQVLSLAQAPVDALVTGLASIVEGTKTVQQVFADFLKTIANQLIQTASTMIAQYIAMGIARSFAMGTPFDVKAVSADISNSITSFQIPNFTPSPLKFANGGNPPVGKASLVGERGPELFVPRTSGTIIPNHALGGGTTSVTVNVDASGTNVSGNSNQASQLGKAISVAVQAELVKQKRPGGLLAGI